MNRLYGDNGDIDEDLTGQVNGDLCGVLEWAEFGDWFYGYVEDCHVGIIMDFYLIFIWLFEVCIVLSNDMNKYIDFILDVYVDISIRDI